MRRYAIFGASGFGREVMPLARYQLHQTTREPYQLVFVDDNPPAAEINGHAVFTYEDWMAQEATSRHVCIAIASSAVRHKLALRLEGDGVSFFSVQAQNVVVMDDVQMGAGSVLCPFVTLTSNIRIGKHFHANLYGYIAHDCVIGDFVTFGPGVHCNGNVVIEDYAYVGTNVTLKQGTPGGEPLVIGRGAVIGMGAVVTKSVAPGAMVVGNPAREMAPRDVSSHTPLHILQEG
jgi:sugar O-acyltransferase (sialic acid O-acetyltransferase NeuD family)